MERVILDNAELTSNSTPTPPSRAWGFIAARPSEYLIVFRNGKLAEKLCGQGARFFKRPSDTYVIIPTTLKEVIFHANQVTTDFVDVRVRGMVVYRVIEPPRIYQLINFADRVQAEAKLAQMISDMCRSAAKRLVANLRLDECMRRRREEIASLLHAEVGAVATGRWGVEVATLDIQDVFIQDAGLFQAMQAGFKAEKDREAQMARLELDRTLAARRLEDERALDKERQELELGRIALARRREEHQFELERLRAVQAREKAAEEQERDRLAAEARRERVRIRAEARRTAHDEQIRALRERLAAESGAGRASLERLFLTDALPALAQAVTKSLEGARMHVYQTGGGQEGGGFLPLALNQLLDLMQKRLDQA